MNPAKQQQEEERQAPATESQEAKHPEQELLRTEPTVQLIVFRMGRELYAVRIEKVKEVTIVKEITPIPKVPDYVLGVANIRGDIIAVMDLQRRFNTQAKQNGLELLTNSEGLIYILVLEGKNYTMGMRLQEVPEAHTVASTAIDKAPAVVAENAPGAAFIEGIVRMNDQLVILLDAEKIFRFEDININNIS